MFVTEKPNIVCETAWDQNGRKDSPIENIQNKYLHFGIYYYFSLYMSDNITPPIVKKNRAPEEYFPLTTEEPVRRPWLRTELENINATDVDELENLTMGDDTSESSDDDSVIGKNKIKQMIKEEAQDTGDIMDCLAREMIDYEAKLNGETEEYEQRVANAETEGDILAEDPELLRRTENNRYIPFEEDIKPVLRVEPNEKNILLEKDLLVFSDQTATIEDTNRVVVVQYYGAGKSGVMPNTHHTKRKPKTYLVACDFSKESLYAMEWTMGAMMRDGDELHVATVANRDDNPEGVKATGLDQAGEVVIELGIEWPEF